MQEEREAERPIYRNRGSRRNEKDERIMAAKVLYG
jgi:hypothetical protein